MIEDQEVTGRKLITEQNSSRLDLTGEWLIRQEGSEDWLTASVPGSNFIDLLKNQKIEDPFYGDNEDKLQWIEKENWEYKKIFLFEHSLEDNDSIELVFEGLDTYCEVLLNGHLILSSSNMFVEYRVSVEEYLCAGDNELLLRFISPINTVEERDDTQLIYPAENDKSESKHSAYTRKAPYHFGWDWGPRYVTSGIWKPVYLEIINKAKIRDTCLVQHWSEGDEVTLTVCLDIEGFQTTLGSIDITCEQLKIVHNKPISIAKGEQKLNLTLSITNPEKWWPNGLGDAKLYDFTIRLNVEGDQVQKVDQRIGFREIEVVNEPDEHGESFYIKVNGHPIFMKGANYIPSDSFPTNVSPQKYRKIFEDTVSANMNMLRVWGGGYYENDIFYDLADEYGVLIWQDFMFACTLYPPASYFEGGIQEEVKQTILRLRNHASLALWCGNNEVSMGIEFWEWPEKFNYSNEVYEKLKNDYSELFDYIIPELVNEYDPEHFYFPSSPIGFWENLADDNKGDNHYWGVWHGEEDFPAYQERVPRFMSEYGFQSFPIQSSIDQFIAKADQSLDSKAITTHQKHPRGNRIINETIGRYYKQPNQFEHFLYLGQLVQAEGLKVAFEAHRRAMPFCMGTLYWQLNDCWPSVSWSSIDYYGKWKALHYQAKRSFSKYLVSILPGKEDDLEFYLINDDLFDKEVCLQIRILSKDGVPVAFENEAVVLKGNTSAFHKKLRRSALPKDVIGISARLLIEDQVVNHNTYYFAKVKDLELKKPDFNYVIRKKGEEVIVCLRSSSFIKNLFVDFNGSKGNFSNNFFDLFPGEEMTMSYRLQEGESFGDLRFLSVFDTIK